MLLGHYSLCCQTKDAASVIVVPDFGYATTGAFAVNLWMSADPTKGPIQGRQWLFVHTNGSEPMLAGPNQVTLQFL